MNEQEAIKDIRENICTGKGSSILCRDECMYGERRCAYQLAMQALEKQIAKKPIDTSKNPKEWHIMSCPSCGRAFWNSGQFMRYMPKWCEKCGQHIDWTVEE